MQLFESISDELLKNGFISQENKEACTFGLKQGASFLLNITTILVIGIILEMFLQSVIFILTYMPLRVFAGGYHAKTHLKCFLLGIPFILCVLLLEKIFVLNSVPIIILGIISSAAMFVIVPIQNDNKPLEQIEVEVYQKTARFILLTENCIMLIFFLMGKHNIAIYITSAHVMLCVILILGKIMQAFENAKIKKEYIHEKNNFTNF